MFAGWDGDGEGVGVDQEAMDFQLVGGFDSLVDCEDDPQACGGGDVVGVVAGGCLGADSKGKDEVVRVVVQ